MKVESSTNDFQEGLYSTLGDLGLQKKSHFKNLKGCCIFEIRKIQQVYIEFKVNLKDTYIIVSGVLEGIDGKSSKMNSKEE